jgi:hypothetical protein
LEERSYRGYVGLVAAGVASTRDSLDFLIRSHPEMSSMIASISISKLVSPDCTGFGRQRLSDRTGTSPIEFCGA